MGSVTQDIHDESFYGTAQDSKKRKKGGGAIWLYKVRAAMPWYRCSTWKHIPAGILAERPKLLERAAPVAVMLVVLVVAVVVVIVLVVGMAAGILEKIWPTSEPRLLWWCLLWLWLWLRFFLVAVLVVGCFRLSSAGAHGVATSLPWRAPSCCRRRSADTYTGINVSITTCIWRYMRIHDIQQNLPLSL